MNVSTISLIVISIAGVVISVIGSMSLVMCSISDDIKSHSCAMLSHDSVYYVMLPHILLCRPRSVHFCYVTILPGLEWPQVGHGSRTKPWTLPKPLNPQSPISLSPSISGLLGFRALNLRFRV